MIIPQKILGPFLMRPTSSSMGFWMASGPQTNVRFKIKIFQGTQLIEEITAQKLAGSCLGVCLAESAIKLNSDTKYTYHCLADDVALFEGKFKTLPEKTDLPFYFVSCNGISYYEWHHPEKDAWRVWKVLQEEVEIEIAPPLMFMCGDQVYMDVMFQEDIKRTKEIPDDIMWQKIYEVYFAHWKDFSYLKVLGQVPAFMMGDDHDFLDGFGSREEQFSAKGESPNWHHYRKFVTQAFWEMQAVRNGERNEKSFLWQKKIGNAHFVMPDLRTERNFFKHQMLSLEQKASLENYISSQVKTGETLYFISTVTLGRMGRGAEIFLSNFSNYLWRLNSWLGRDSNIKKVVFTLLISLFFAANENFIYGVFFFSLWWLLAEMGKGKSDFHRLIHKMMTIMAASGAFVSGAYLFHSNDLPTFSLPTLPFNILLLLGAISSCLGNFYKNFFFPSKVKKYAVIASTFFVVAQFIHFKIFSLFFVIFTLLEGLGFIDLLASADDDMKDAWGAEVNSGELRWLSSYFSKLVGNGVNVIFLTGDIHTGGVASFSLKDFPDKKIYHLISSPIAYFPMSASTEKLTSAKKTISLPWKKPVLDFTNHKYFSQRHFAHFSPGNPSQVEFTFEDGSRQSIILTK